MVIRYFLIRFHKRQNMKTLQQIFAFSSNKRIKAMKKKINLLESPKPMETILQ